jgi:diguanylate cyclase (GGDEF)-like protein
LNSALAVPLQDGDSVIGVLALYHSDRDAYSKDQLRVLQAMSGKLTTAIANSLKRDPAPTVSNTDELTGLPNARALFLHLDAEIACCASGGSTLAMLACDVDGFRQVNDRYGRIAGDELLRSVARQLRASCRGSDYVARLGGDEIAAVMGNVSRPAADQRMSDFDRIVRETGRKLCGEEIVALSCGYVLFPEDGSTAEQLLAEADRRMHKHKKERRNAAPTLAAEMA